jgi:multiple antibiotic resistance protein
MMDYTFFITTLTIIFVIVDPITSVIPFISLTSGMDTDEKRATARRSVIVASIILLTFALTGDLFLSFFQIGIGSLRIAGGILLFLVAIDMMYARRSGESYTSAEFGEEREDISVFPIAIPLLAGPGAITTVILLMGMADSIVLKAMVIISIMITFMITWFFFTLADRIYGLLGVTGSMVIRRIMGLFLAAISVEFISEGVWDIYLKLSSV